MKKIIMKILFGILLLPTFLLAENTVTILDKSNDKPLAATTVRFTSLEGTSKGKTQVKKSDKRGMAEIPVTGKIAVYIRFVGYENLLDTLQGNRNYTFKLNPTSIMLNEIVTTGQFSPQSLKILFIPCR